MENVYSQIATKIIAQQETIIGPVAIEQAKVVKGLNVNWADHKVSITGQAPSVIDRLVTQYKQLFGKMSVDVCKDASSGLISKLPFNERPKSLTS